MKILILGQLPPPYGGQAINIEKMLHVLNNEKQPFRFIRMDFSNELNDMGRLSIKKMMRLAHIFTKLIWQLFAYRPDVVYYPPAGPQRVPMFRDMVLLLPVRLTRVKTIFHFHAGGISGMYGQLGLALRALYRFAYFRPTHAICLSESGKTDPLFLKAKHIHIIHSGVDSIGQSMQAKVPGQFTVLFAGLCSESKGILDYLQVIRLANAQHPGIHGVLLGNINSEKEASQIRQAEREGIVSYKGIQTGEAKNNFFRQADLFLFPSFFEAENFPTVIIEAFSAGLPVVASDWRGIPDQVRNGYTGFVRPVHDVTGLADAVVWLANNPGERLQMGANARHDFETKYTMDSFAASISNFFKSLA